MPRKIGTIEIEDIALGAAVLGTGGGGDPYIGKLMAAEAIDRFGPVDLIDLDDLADDDLVICSAMMGAPTVMVEKIPAGEEFVRAFEAIEARLGRKARAVMSAEAGGLNSTTPFITAAAMRRPLVDADGMGRAFPELQMVTLTLYGLSATPMSMADEKGNVVVLDCVDNLWTERLARTATVEMGCTAMIALYAATGAQLREAACRNTISLAQRVGAAIRTARAQQRDAVTAVLDVTGGFRLFKGKIVDVGRRTERGFARGHARLEGLGEHAGRTLEIEFQNEHLVARTDDRVLCSVPDLICLVDAESGEPITTEAMRYGFRVEVLGIPCDPRWRTAAGLELVGPGYFGYDFEYVPVEERVQG
ncbi:MAG TPA: DUF917 domain-containing protein [Bacillota bacterium]